MYIKCYIFFPLYMLPYLLPLLINPSLSPLFSFFFLFCGSSQGQMSKDWIETINWTIVGSPGVTVLKPMTSNISWIYQRKIVQLEEWRPWAMLPTKPECWWKQSCTNSGRVCKAALSYDSNICLIQTEASHIRSSNLPALLFSHPFYKCLLYHRGKSIHKFYSDEHLSLVYSQYFIQFWVFLLTVTHWKGFFTKDDCSICLWP